MNKLEDGKGGFDNIRKALKNIKNEIDELKSPKKKKQVNLKKEMKINEKSRKKETKKTEVNFFLPKRKIKCLSFLRRIEEVGKNMTVLQYKMKLLLWMSGQFFQMKVCRESI